MLYGLMAFPRERVFSGDGFEGNRESFIRWCHDDDGLDIWISNEVMVVLVESKSMLRGKCSAFGCISSAYSHQMAMRNAIQEMSGIALAVPTESDESKA